jgi:hypothetical protein
MLTTQAITELRGRTGVSSLDAVCALSICEGRIEQAMAFLTTSRAPPRMLHVVGSHLAERLTESLLHSGLWFEREQQGRENWRFAVAPAGYAQLLALHVALLADLKSECGERGHRSAGAERTPARFSIKSANGCTV